MSHSQESANNPPPSESPLTGYSRGPMSEPTEDPGVGDASLQDLASSRRKIDIQMLSADLPKDEFAHNATDAPLLKHNRRDYPFTIAFSLVILLSYALTTAQSGFTHISRQALMAGSFYPPLVLQGEWWRFISASLLHAHPSHLLNNLFGVVVFGSLLEPVIGSLRLLGLYLFSGILGLLFSLWFLPDGSTIGASAIDFGLMGAYFTGVLLQRYQSNRAVFSGQLRSAIFFILFFVGWNTLEIGTVNIWAHIGGLLAGVLFAVIFAKAYQKPL
jgi:rhomboid protease GluP